MNAKEIRPFESAEDIRKVFEHAGRAVPSSTRMAHWRRVKLLKPAIQTAMRGVRGSRICYPIGTARQALEIDWLLEQTGKYADVGWLLW